MLGYLVRNLDGKVIAGRRRVCNRTDEYLASAVLTGLRGEDDNARPVFPAIYQPGIAIVLPQEIVADDEAGFRPDFHDLFQ